MTIVFDSGAVSSFSQQRARLHQLRDRGLWPPLVPAVVLAEALTGDQRRDFHTNRLLRACQIEPVDEWRAREAARIRTATGRAAKISAVDAIVAATADSPGGVVFTSDPDDLRALAEHTRNPITVVPV